MKNEFLRAALLCLLTIFPATSLLSQNVEGMYVGQTEAKALALINKTLVPKGYKVTKDSYYAKDIQANVTDYVVTKSKDDMPALIYCVQKGKVRNFFMTIAESVKYEKRTKIIKKLKAIDTYQYMGNGFFLNKDSPGETQYDLYTYIGSKKTGIGYIVLWGCPNMNLKETRMDLFNKATFVFEILK